MDSKIGNPAGARRSHVALRRLPASERPRERLAAHGPQALTDRELLALVLRHGHRTASAIDLAAEILAEHSGLAQLSEARPEELTRQVGMGAAKAAAVVAAFELGRRATQAAAPPVLRGPDDVAAAARGHLDGLRHERVVVLVCDSGNRLRRIVTVSEGSADRALLPVREILNAVLRNDGRAFAIAHNHPSGDCEPSDADRAATVQISDAARTAGLRFLGHVVIAGSRSRPA